MNTFVIKEIYEEIQKSGLFRKNGQRIQCLSTLIIELCEAINAFEGDTEEWCYLGESGDCCLSDFIAGAYWSFSEWHAGQYSVEYEALSALGSIFSPGCTSAPESEDEPEWTAYNACDEWFQNRADD